MARRLLPLRGCAIAFSHRARANAKRIDVESDCRGRICTYLVLAMDSDFWYSVIKKRSERQMGCRIDTR